MKSLNLLALSVLVTMATSSSELLAEHEYEEPTTREQRLFDTKADRYDSAWHYVDPEKRVDWMLSSFDSEFKWEIQCTGTPPRKVVIKINSHYAKWDENWVNEQIGEGHKGACLHEAVYTPEFYNGVKDVEIDFYVMIDPDVAEADENAGVMGELTDLGTFYHELLHGQLLINAIMNNQEWADAICNCTFDDSPMDNDHELGPVNEWEEEFLSDIDVVFGVFIPRPPPQQPEGEDCEFDADLGELEEDEDVNNYYIIPISNIAEEPAPVVEIIDGHLRLIGQLANPSFPGYIMARIQTSNRYIILGTEQAMKINPCGGSIPILNDWALIILAGLIAGWIGHHFIRKVRST